MNRKFLICVLGLGVVVFGTGRSFGCPCQDPVASMSIEPSTYDPYAGKYYVCAWQSVTFDASASYDPDCEDDCDCEDTLEGIRKFEWDWTNDGTYDDSDEPGDGITTHTYFTTGTYYVKVRVHDDDDDCCCSGTECEDKTDTWTATVVVVDVHKVVEAGTSDEGDLYTCKDGDIDLEAKPDPAGALWPPGSPVWSVSGPAGSLFPETHSDTTTLSDLNVAGIYTVTAKCCSSSLGDWITVKALEIRSETESTEPSDRSRTTLGLGEKVLCSVYPPVSVTWEVDEGSVLPDNGMNTDFTASKSPANSTVHAKIGTVDCTLDFEVIAPEGITYEPDDAWTDGFPLTNGPPNNFIGNGRKFPAIIQPTTVSFKGLEFRENKPGNTWTWPDLTPDSTPKKEIDFIVDFGNHVTDKVQAPPEPYSRLHDGTSYVGFDYMIDVPLEYRNEDGEWVEFMSASENRHQRIFTASGTCSLKVIGDNTQESDPKGPWQDSGEE